MRLVSLLALAAAVPALALPALAQTWPARSLRILVPFGPGGPTDVVARILANGLSASLGQPVVIENRGGAGGNIGVTAAARAAADGYTLLVTSAGFVINAGLFRNPGYDPVRDFAPVSRVVNNATVFVVNPANPATDAADFVKDGRVEAGRRAPDGIDPMRLLRGDGRFRPHRGDGTGVMRDTGTSAQKFPRTKQP